MFTILNAVLTFSFLISIVNSTPRPSAQDLDPNFNDAQNTNLFLDEMSNNDDLTISTPLTSMDTNLFGNQENLFAADTSTGNSCRAEDSQSLPLFGRLRRRQISSSGSGGDHLCTTNEASGPTLNPSLLDLPIAEDINVPDEQRRPEICPPWKFGTYRTLALCSAALPFDGISSEGQKILIVSNAMICMYRPTPGMAIYLQPVAREDLGKHDL